VRFVSNSISRATWRALSTYDGGEVIGNRELAELGHGGLLSREMAYRFPPYRANAARGELE